MLKNDRPNEYDPVGRLRVFNLDRIPPEYASKTEWRRRGYKVRTDQARRPMGWVEHWNGRGYIQFSLYTRLQVITIRGKKAANRRLKFALPF